MDNKIYKCCVLLTNYPDSYYTTWGKTEGLTIDIWEIIKQKISKK